MNKFLKIIIGIIGIILIGWAFSLFNKPQNSTINRRRAIEVVKGLQAPEATFRTINNKQVSLSDYRGKKVMLWFLATWCSSCSAGARVLAQNNSKLGNLTIIAIETYGDAGYQGPPVKEFAQRTDPNLLSMPNWVWGNASQEATAIYNSRNFPDIYFLIDENGILQDVDSAPAATINKIIQFSNK